jgi:hypothetical protein
MSTKLDKFFVDQGLRPMGTLAHFGVKGQKWGVINSKSAVGIASLEPKGIKGIAVQRDSKGNSVDLSSDDGKVLEKSLSNARKAIMHGNDAQTFLSELNTRVAADYASTKNWNDKAQKTYDDAVVKQFTAVANKSIKATSNVAAKVMITNNDKLLLVVGHPTAIEKYRKDFISHMSEDAVISVTLIPIRETPGIIVGFKDEMTHAADLLENFIAHFGVKGQKWGVRRSDAELAGGQSATTAAGVKIKTNSAGTVVSAKGGSVLARQAVKGKNIKEVPLENADAERARTTLATIKKSKSLSGVSDADLNQLVNRLGIEKRYADATNVPNKVHSKVKTLLGVGKTLNEAVKFSQSPTGQLLAGAAGLTGTGRHAKSAGKHRK